MTLKKRFEAVANEYLLKFIKKQDLDFDGWIGDDVGGIASFICQYFFNFDDIRYDIDNKCKKGLILHWQDDCLENKPNYINYYSYHKGLKFDMLNKEVEPKEFTTEETEKLKEDFKKLLHEKL